MSSRPRPLPFSFPIALAAVLSLSACTTTPRWVSIWSTAPMESPAPAELTNVSEPVLRQVVRVSLGGDSLRLQFSNQYGTTPLAMTGVGVALAEAGGAIAKGSDRSVLFDGRAEVIISPGSTVYSDPIKFPAMAHADLAISVRIQRLPANVTGHPGSRETSYVSTAMNSSEPVLRNATTVVHWYFLTNIEKDSGKEPDSAVACLGDSLTDGHGCQTDSNTRWTDALSERLRGNPATAGVAVLNEGIGGGRLLHPGLGPSGLSRLQRDVLEQAGVKYMILQLGVNDLGTRVKAKAAGQPFARASDIIAGYQQVIDACHAKGIRVAVGTITPFAGAGWYWSPDIEDDRMVINDWIRTKAPCDVVVDFDAGLRDSTHPSLLKAAYDSGDHLHPSQSGYRLMAALVPFSLFAP